MAIPFIGAGAALKALNWKLVGIGLLVLAIAVQTLRLSAAENRAERYKTALTAEKSARAADRRIYEQAQSQAKAKNAQQVQRIEAEQEKISAEQKSKYERDLARLRAGGLRKDLAAPQGASRGTKAGPVPETACKPDGENLLVDRSVLMRAAEIELARNALIDWINAQLGVVR
jgi:hypothetical protein